MKYLILGWAISLFGCAKQFHEQPVADSAKTAFLLGTGTVTTYPWPASLPAAYKSTVFTVTANGSGINLYNAGNNSWNNPVSYGQFDMSGGTVTVAVTPGFSYSTFKIVPASLGLTGTKSGSTITFELPSPQQVTLVFDNNYQGRVLHLFAEKAETNIPSPTDPNVAYYAPGYYDLSGSSPITLASNQTLYIAGGAVIRGRVKIDGVSNVTVRGRGILLNDYNSATDNIALALGGVTNATVRDIIVSRNIGSWTSSMHGCSFVNVINYKAVSPKFASTDGFNINSSHDILFDSVFIHSADDAIAIKGMSNVSPASSLPVYNITYKNAKLWADANNAIGIGAETKASRFENIRFENIDVLYNFDDRDHPNVLPDRSAINIFSLEGTYFKDIHFENIRVEKAKRLINIHMDETFYFGALTGNWTSYPGNMRNITYKNITSTSDGSNEIKLQGWNDGHRIDTVRFENIQINGSYVNNFSDSRFNINRFANALTLVHPGGTVNGDKYNASADFATTQGKRHWYYRGWKAGVGNYNYTWNPDASNHWRGPNAYDAIWNGSGNVYLHPDNSSQAMLEWQAPKAGTVRITGLVKKGNTDGGDGVNVSIWQNGTMVWPSTGWQTIAWNDGTGVSHDFTINVAFGDVISFRVDQRSDPGWDTTFWGPEIIYQ
ncbi:MAG: glycosyl hydrolase family 28 protein [Candidatus Pseudobacter hemicellulosilyticus]|uniref:Glycosyl hydrolase family 28 protein n=1 Tax=Candidatus Pseudobacter hemicellulosilyticus TaxID=3121375 RepID=A0AAJ6BJF3_9BACT|nr:MAG: glycosyl hydrolase family 28 protein [Pseudobacter sp.]